MDDLATIPLRADVNLSDEEDDILREYFGPLDDSGSLESKMTWTDSFKVTGYGMLLFITLGNPWIDALFSKIPKMDNPIILLCTKLAVFAFMLLMLSRFAS